MNNNLYMISKKNSKATNNTNPSCYPKQSNAQQQYPNVQTELPMSEVQSPSHVIVQSARTHSNLHIQSIFSLFFLFLHLIPVRFRIVVFLSSFDEEWV